MPELPIIIEIYKFYWNVDDSHREGIELLGSNEINHNIFLYDLFRFGVCLHNNIKQSIEETIR